jgi:hypothetical protein
VASAAKLEDEALRERRLPTAVTFEPKQTLPAVKRRIAKILLAVRDKGGKPRMKKPAVAHRPSRPCPRIAAT